MRSVVVNAIAGAGGTAVSPPVVIDQYLTPTNAGVSALITSGSPTFRVEISLDDPYATYATDYNTNGNWTLLTAGATGLTANYWANLANTVKAVRTTITAGANSSVQMTIVQGGVQ